MPLLTSTQTPLCLTCYEPLRDGACPHQPEHDAHDAREATSTQTPERMDELTFQLFQAIQNVPVQPIAFSAFAAMRGEALRAHIRPPAPSSKEGGAHG